jgi:hypothetical protein
MHNRLRLRRPRLVLCAALVGLGAAALAIALRPGAPAPRSAALLQLAIRHAQIDPDAGSRLSAPVAVTRPVRAARPAAVGRLRTTALPVFGQPTIAGIGGFGFEADLRLDPSDPTRIYESVPGTGGADTSWVWRSLDGGKTFKWVPSSAPLNGKVTPCVGGGDTELAVDPKGRVYFNDLSLANFSTARSDDRGTTFTCSNTGVPDAGVDRQWYALDGDPIAGGSLYLTNDEIENGNVQCGNTVQNNSLVMYRSPVGAPATAGIAFGPANHITLPGGCDEGIMGNDEVSPVATTTGIGATLATAVKHVYVIHDDGTLSKIRIARCFPVAFGAPIANLSDPSGLDCVDMLVADLGDYNAVRTGANTPTLAIDRAGNLYAVWEQATMSNGQAGDTSLRYAYSTDEGNHWSTPIAIPTPGLANDVFAWAAAGDDGRVDVAWYGTAAHVDLVNGGPDACMKGGPDSVPGSWSVYLTQTLNGHTASPTFSTPVVASETPIKRGSIQTIMGDQCGGLPNNQLATNRTLGDFLQMRVGVNGEAQISYANATNQTAALFGSHAMYVRQIGGPGVLKSRSPSGDQIQINSITDPSGDATYQALGQTSANMPNLDLLASSLSWPKASTCHPAGTACLRIRMKVANLSTKAPVSPDPDTDLVWQTQWLRPSAPTCTSAAASCADGGLNFMAYAEVDDSPNGDGAFHCWVGQNGVMQFGGGVLLTYPGTTEITAPGACAVVTGQGGTITIDVPLSLVSLDAGVAPFSTHLYSVTSSTMTLPQPANTGYIGSGIGGQWCDVVDVARGYEGKPPSKVSRGGELRRGRLTGARERLRQVAASAEHERLHR